MKRQNLFSDAWDGEDEEARTRHRVFWRPEDSRMGATLYELTPGAPDEPLHMHYGARARVVTGPNGPAVLPVRN